MRLALLVALFGSVAQASPTARIWFDPRQPFSRPLLKGTVAGLPVVRVLDTGAPFHLLGLRAARSAQLALEPGPSFRDFELRDHPSFELPPGEVHLAGLQARVAPLFASAFGDEAWSTRARSGVRTLTASSRRSGWRAKSERAGSGPMKIIDLTKPDPPRGDWGGLSAEQLRAFGESRLAAPDKLEADGGGGGISSTALEDDDDNN